MKRQLYLNRRLYELDLFEQNKYLGERINTIKPAIYNKSSSLDYKNYFTNKNMIKRKST
jgi:hypothetical protein